MNPTHDEPLCAILLGGREDQQIRECCAVLTQFNYRYSRYETVKSLLNGISSANVDLLLLDQQSIDADELGHIKNKLANVCIPIIILAGHTREELLEPYFNQGVDDFLAKPVNPALLKAKLRSLTKVRQMLHQHKVDCKQLSAYHQLVEQEQAVAINLYENILRVNYLETPVVKPWVSARSLFKGDIVLVGKTPDNRLHALLGDFSGYGISAYVAAAPTAEIFYGMSAKGFDITEITQEINRKLHQLLPSNMFLTAAIVGLDPNTKTLHALNCGMPEQVLVKRSSGSHKPIVSNNLPLGILGDVDLQLQTFEVSGKDYLYLLSRAVSEAKNAAGRGFGHEAIMECLSQHEASAFDDLIARLRQHCGNKHIQQEITFVELHCDVDNAPWKSDVIAHEFGHIDALAWKTMMEFDITTLKKLNPVPVVVNALMEIQGLQEHRQTIFLIVTELFANALDHGLLKLDSAIKQTAEGFMRYYELRDERLRTVQAGTVRIQFNHQPTETGGRLIIKLKDSGDGFLRNEWVEDLNNNRGFSGRGIALLRSLCSSIRYQGVGNRVTVVFDWRH
ncbi:SpoIIE family protein phosphatase [Methylomarinum vadi]|uniref:SpoIIE family protein phosphatase n=1 Tax=Methylomarinum vadi TaxID=438855 RepID=UPI0006903205|nr:SpoIIE family protein phosphatase [Methylomarinum vadi]